MLRREELVLSSPAGYCSKQSCANPGSARQRPGEGGSAPPSDLGRGLLNLLFARFVLGIKSNKLLPGVLILSFSEELRAFTEH